MRLPRFAVVALTLGLCIGNLAFTLWRSTIPLELDGKVQSVEFLTEKNPGIDDVHVLRINGESFHIDKALATRLTANVYVAKEPWSTELTVGKGSIERTIDLGPSEDFEGMLIVTPVVLIVFVVVLYRPRRDGTTLKGTPPA